MGKDQGSCGWQAAADRGGGCTRQVAADDGGQALPFQPPRATKPVALLRDTARAGVVSLPFGDPTRLGTWPTTGAWHLWTTATAGLWVVRGASRLWVAVAVVACRRRGVPVWAAGACRAAVAGACRGRPSWSTTDTGGRSIQKAKGAPCGRLDGRHASHSQPSSHRHILSIARFPQPLPFFATASSCRRRHQRSRLTPAPL